MTVNEKPMPPLPVSPTSRCSSLCLEQRRLPPILRLDLSSGPSEDDIFVRSRSSRRTSDAKPS